MKITEKNWKEELENKYLLIDPIMRRRQIIDFIQSLITSVKQEERKKLKKLLRKMAYSGTSGAALSLAFEGLQSLIQEDGEEDK